MKRLRWKEVVERFFGSGWQNRGRCRRAGTLAAFLLLTCGATSSKAQTSAKSPTQTTTQATATLTLHGRVLDENGLPVIGAQVKLETAGGLPVYTLTGDSGYFTVANLAAGEFTVRIEKPGYFVLQNQKVQLAPDSTEFGFTLNHVEEVHEKVDVTAPTEQIDTRSTQSTATLSNTEIIDIPVASSHDLLQSLVAMPQVLRDNSLQLHIAGANSTEVQYLLDGVEVGDPASNGLTSRMIVDAVRSAEIQTGRFGAEYAHPGGAVLSYDTREGDDRWRFNATDFIPGVNLQQGSLYLGDYYPRVTFSGPILANQVWFAQSFDLLHTLSVVYGLPKGAPDTSTEWGGDSWSRLLWKISTNNSLHAAFLANVTQEQDAGLTALMPQSTTTTVDNRELFGFVKEQGYFEKAVTELGFAIEDSLNNAVPQGTQPYILLVNGAEGNYFQKQQQDARRYQIFGDAVRTPMKWLGAHTISVGGNFSSVELTQESTRGEIQALSAAQTLSRLSTFVGDPNFHITNTLAGGFAQDSWAPDGHFVIQAGVRADWDRLFQAALVQPRLAANYLPFKNNRAKFSIGWGTYDIPLNLALIGQAYDQQEVDTLYDPTGKIPIAGPATSAFILPAKGLTSLQQPYFDIWSAGWEQRFGQTTLVSVELLARDQHHGLVYQTLSPGQIGSDFALQSTREDKYRGATVSARHTFKNQIMLFGAYTRSKADSNEVLQPVLGSLYFAPQQPGPLSWDAPNRLLSWGTIPTPIWGIMVSYLFDYHTGFPYSAINQEQFLIGAPNSYRFPDYASLTLGFEKKFTFKKRIFAARLSVINILDRQNPDVVVNNVDAPNFGMFTGGQGRAVTARLRFLGRK
ncbi:MAG TPA: carboxypeptidase regulatory-like domain-containing protein [Candidatus Sulfotelmatobacter sp.]|nr:carboxypeptidase regulatory-like domain-containing protein [Candidatus Sulfotelmatobacter sp.]